MKKFLMTFYKHPLIIGIRIIYITKLQEKYQLDAKFHHQILLFLSLKRVQIVIKIFIMHVVCILMMLNIK
jgi:hypothetical protein